MAEFRRQPRGALPDRARRSPIRDHRITRWPSCVGSMQDGRRFSRSLRSSSTTAASRTVRRLRRCSRRSGCCVLMARCGLDTGDEPVLRAAREELRHEAHRPDPLRADWNAFTVSDVSVDHDPQGVRLRPSLVERAVGHAGQLLRYGPQELGVVGVVGSVVGWHDLRVSALFHEAARPEVLTADRVGIG